ncbi:hypothetical protein FACS1894166_01460 [Bacilli bacterium]|nr:hypothetical protein FACS1894166_01460 [Bacilli bacterium]
MEQTVVSIRMNKNKKVQLDTVADMMGITTTGLINIFIERVITTKALPFKLEVPINPGYYKALRHLAQNEINTRSLPERSGAISEDVVMDYIYEIRGSKRAKK